ncbi:ferrous iron transport protein A [Desulfobaculum bizertense]|nr:FeoA family protein [Desulfobaculum bizertense]UIJ37787.1 ferrous iron transport protein A [Desulfobaculum bizertense]
MWKRKCHRHCRKSRALCEYPGGSQVAIADIQGCPRQRCRLLAMGLTPGTRAEICRHNAGSCCLRVRNCDLILGEDMAQYVMATPVQDQDRQTA